MMTVGVVGAGAMGSGIAQVALRNGHPVILADVEKSAALKAKENIAGAFAREVEKGRLTSEAAADAQARLSVASLPLGLGDFAPCELVVEAIVEAWTPSSRFSRRSRVSCRRKACWRRIRHPFP